MLVIDIAYWLSDGCTLTNSLVMFSKLSRSSTETLFLLLMMSLICSSRMELAKRSYCLTIGQICWIEGRVSAFLSNFLSC